MSGFDFDLGIIGAGQMGYAIAEGAIKAGVVKNVLATRPSFKNPKICEKWEAIGAKCSVDNTEVVRKCSIVILAVKPQLFDQITDILQNLTKTQIVVSVIAGKSTSVLSKLCGEASVTRIVLNTACLVQAGAITMAAPENTSEEVLKRVENIFTATSGCFHRVPERTMDALTAVAGSGIAFVYQFIEALSDGGVHAGLPRDLATSIAAQTVLGAGKMVLETAKHPGQLKDEVTSPGGTTIAGVRALEKGGLRSAVIEAVNAASERSKELGKLA